MVSTTHHGDNDICVYIISLLQIALLLVYSATTAFTAGTIVCWCCCSWPSPGLFCEKKNVFDRKKIIKKNESHDSTPENQHFLYCLCSNMRQSLSEIMRSIFRRAIQKDIALTCHYCIWFISFSFLVVFFVDLFRYYYRVFLPMYFHITIRTKLVMQWQNRWRTIRPLCLFESILFNLIFFDSKLWIFAFEVTGRMKKYGTANKIW